MLQVAWTIKGSLEGEARFKAGFQEAALGILERLILSDERWDRISPHIIGDKRTRGSSGRDNRIFVEAVLWIVRTGSPWRDLPDVFGEWNSAFRRFSRWSSKDVWWRIFEAVPDDPDFEYLIVDSTIIRAHQHAAGAKRELKIKPSAALAVARAPKSTWRCETWAARSASRSPPRRRSRSSAACRRADRLGPNVSTRSA